MAALYQTALDDLAQKNKIQPFTNTFDESQGVEGRVNRITSAGSPLLTTAETQAKQDTARRGLMNSSIGVQAGRQAVINTALPIAQADASLFQQQSLTNQQAQNQAASQNASNAINAGTRGVELDVNASQFADNMKQADKDFGLRQQQVDNQASQFTSSQNDANRRFDAELAQNAKQFSLTQDQQRAMQSIDIASKERISQMEADFKTEIQSSANMANAWGEMMRGISVIQTDPNLEEATKAQLINNNLEQFKAYSAFWGKAGSVDVSDLLAFGAVQPAPGKPSSTQPENQPQQQQPAPPWMYQGQQSTGGDGTGGVGAGGSGSSDGSGNADGANGGNANGDY